MKDSSPTADEILQAHKIFLEKESRDVFYRAAKELVDLSRKEQISLKLEEVISLLLQTWNMMFYRYHKEHFNEDHFQKLASLLRSHEGYINGLMNRSIDTLEDNEKSSIEYLFNEFELLLGPVGTAKCLHLLAPKFFPLWDRKIAAKGYGIYIKKIGQNRELYYTFMRKQKDQCNHFSGGLSMEMNPLKVLDEYNYCIYTKGWIKSR
jgi:hypothetical protein